MVAKLKTLKDLDFSRRSSAYVDPDCDAFIDIPVIFYNQHGNDIALTTCQGCFPFLEGKQQRRVEEYVCVCGGVREWISYPEWAVEPPNSAFHGGYSG